MPAIVEGFNCRSAASFTQAASTISPKDGSAIRSEVQSLRSFTIIPESNAFISWHAVSFFQDNGLRTLPKSILPHDKTCGRGGCKEEDTREFHIESTGRTKVEVE